MDTNEADDADVDTDERHVREAFPELGELEDHDLRDGVIEAWTSAMAATSHHDLEAIPWYPPVQRELGIEDESLVSHVRDVTQGAISLAEVLEKRRAVGCSMELVIAGGLVHDISKLYEFQGPEATPINDLLGHPYYGVHAVAAAGLPVEVQHIVLSHTDRTSVEPAIIEAEIVRRADETAAAAIRLQALDDLREA